MDVRHVWICLGNPKAYREVYSLTLDHGGARSHLNTQSIRQNESRLAAGLGQQQTKLVAPSLATVSEPRLTELHTDATILSTLSPRSWPNRSLMILKQSTSISSTEKGRR